MPRDQVSIHEIEAIGAEAAEGLVAAFEYPGESMAVTREQLTEIVIRILPSKSLPGPRRVQSGYRRFAVLAWLLSPDAFNSSNVEELAVELGVTPSSIYKTMDKLRELFEGAGPS